MGTFMFGSQFSESKMRKISIPCAADSRDELRDDVIRIGGIADGIGCAQQHLKADVRNRFAQALQSLPRIFMQEAQGHVEGRAAPHLQAVKIMQAAAETNLAIASMSWLRMRVAKSD